MKNNICNAPGTACRQLAPFILRIVIGFGFMAHGWAKFTKGADVFADFLFKLHVPQAHLMAWITIVTELVGGIALIMGLLTRFFTLPLIIIMLVAMFTIHINYGFSAVKTIGYSAQGPVFGPPGYEINLVYIAALVALFILGSGRYSVDALIVKKPKIQTGYDQ